MEILAEMVANVLRVDIRPGQKVREGDGLVLLESMKMEIPLFAPYSGVVQDVLVVEGDVVQEGDVIVVLSA